MQKPASHVHAIFDMPMPTISVAHAARIQKEIRQAGAVRYNLWLPEARSLARIIGVNEHILGIVFGRYKKTPNNGMLVGRGALVVTNERVLLVDKKPLFLRFDEISFGVISAVVFTKAGPAGTVTLYSKIGTIQVRTFNQQCALSFIRAIEKIIVQRQAKIISEP